MRCAECGLYECALRSPMGGCPNGERAEALGIITTPDTNPFPRCPYEKGYEPADKSRLRHKESWVTTAKKELECSELLDEARLKAVKEIRVLKDKMREICNSSRELVKAVEGYIAPKKGDKYVFRNEVLAKCNKVKKLLGK